MRVGDRQYRLVRGMFAPTGLRELTIVGPDGDVEDFVARLYDADRHEQYQRAVLADSGLGDFSQLAFLQLFVFTFDEARQLLFWDDTPAQAALFIAFGGSAETARAVELTERRWTRPTRSYAISNGRPAGSAISCSALTAAQQGRADRRRDLQAEHDRLEESVSHGRREFRAHQCRCRRPSRPPGGRDRPPERAAGRLRARLRRASRHAARAAGHPVVLETLEDGRCALCATEGDDGGRRRCARHWPSTVVPLLVGAAGGRGRGCRCEQLHA